MQNGADCDIVDGDSGNTPLHMAAANGFLYFEKYIFYSDIVHVLISRGAENVKNNSGNTPLRIYFNII